MEENIPKCPACYNLFIGYGIWKDFSQWSEGGPSSIERINLEASNGCTSCEVLQRFISSSCTSDVLESSGGYFEIDSQIRLEPTGIRFDDNPENDLEFFTLRETRPSGLWSPFRASHLLSCDTSSEDCLEKARAWIERCISSHSRCGAPPHSSPPKLPKRVIDVTPLDGDGSVKLVEPSNENGDYICLSHCWGKSVLPPKTLTSNIQSRRSFIAWETLPATFQDAIDFVRRLGQRYLWIDSLCIIQDAVDDWEDQAAQMADIYQNSYLTLAATGSRDCTGGLYYADPGYSATALSIQYEWTGPYNVYCRKRVQHFVTGRPKTAYPSPAAYFQQSQRFPLLSRAWTFQERLLSPRVLHFCQAELWWECYECFTCECTDGGIMEPHTTFPKKDHGQVLDMRPEMRVLHWHKLVHEYSNLHMTNMGDRLHALQGIGEQMLNGSHNRILSGLWEENLLLEMCWIVRELRDKPYKWRAPSWSWASTDSHISYIYASESPENVIEYATVLDVGIVDGQRHDRPVLNAKSMRLSAPLLSGVITSPRGEDAREGFDFSEDLGSRPPWRIDVWDTYRDGVPLSCRVYCAGLVRVRKNKDCIDLALILQPTDENNNVFYRIGFMEYGRVPNNSLSEEFPSVHDQGMFEGVEKKTITLV